MVLDPLEFENKPYLVHLIRWMENDIRDLHAAARAVLTAFDRGLCYECKKDFHEGIKALRACLPDEEK